MIQLGENLWFLSYPMKMLGLDFRRNVSVIRLASGELVIHSTGPFTADDVTSISAVGKPGWIVDVMLRHDTFSKEGRDAFPGIPFLAPPGFGEHVEFPVEPILPAPWGDELQVIEVGGIPSVREHVFFHPVSRTLIVADLVFNFPPDLPFWNEIVLKLAITGDHHLGMSVPFKSAIKDGDAFKASIAKILAWDFDRVVVGHGVTIENGGKPKLTAVFEKEGYV